MSVRTFTAASSEKITLSLGQLGFAFGPGTIAVIVRLTTTGVQRAFFCAGASSAAQYQLGLSATNIPQVFCNANGATAGSALAASTWYLVAVTKATGSVAPRLHVFDYTAGTWAHTNSGTSIANSSSPITRAALGTNAAGTGNFFNGDMAAAGVWNVVLTDTQIEALLLFSPAIPKGLWRLNQDAVGTSVLDLTGGGANQSAIVGTTVTAVNQPVGMMNTPPPLPVPDRLQAVPRASLW